jgi:hypothetical protein
VTRNNNDLLCISDDAILEFQKQAQRDAAIFSTAREVEDELQKDFFGLKVKVDQLLQMRQCEI